MRKSSAAGLVVAVAAASVVAVTTPALAATISVSPGGSVTGSAGTTKLHDNVTGKDLTCVSSSVSATLKSGPNVSNPIGSITAVTFTTCTGPAGIRFNVTSGALPWSLSAGPGLTVSGVTPGTINGIHATLGGFGCSATVDGSSATANNGSVNGSYDNGTGKLTTSGGTLHAYNVSGCLGNINNNDSVTFLGTYAISPVQTINVS